jgi:nucleotide-binding universal stress UspA family protein
MGPHRLHILIATDFSPSADAAIGEWLGLLARPSAVIELVHVMERASNPALEGLTLATSPSMSAWVAAELEKRVSRLRAMGFPCEAQMLHGVPARQIVQQARDRDASLVILGTRGRRGVLGSVAAAVLGDAPCPVLIMEPAASA